MSNLGEAAAGVVVLPSGPVWDCGDAESPSARAIRASDSERFFLDAEGGAKKDVMLLSAFDFLAAEARSVALRFREAADMVFGLRGIREERSGAGYQCSSGVWIRNSESGKAAWGSFYVICRRFFDAWLSAFARVASFGRDG